MSFLLLCGDLQDTTLAYYLYSMTQIELNIVTKLLNIFKKRELDKKISPQMRAYSFMQFAFFKNI